MREVIEQLERYGAAVERSLPVVPLPRASGSTIDRSSPDGPDANVELMSIGTIVPTDGLRRARRRLVGAVAIGAAAALIVFALALRSGDDATSPITASVPTTTPSLQPLPNGFDPQSAPSFFSGEGTAEQVAMSYLRDRLHEPATSTSSVGIEVGAESVTDSLATIRWSRSDRAEGALPTRATRVLTSGLVYLRRSGSQWEVTASTTEGVSLSGVARDDERVRGTIINQTTQPPVSADVVDIGGKPVPAAPFPTGVPGAHYLYATAGVGTGEVTIDVAVPDTPVLLRVHTVGDTLLSVSEIRLDPPANPAPSAEECALRPPPYVFSSLPDGWAVSLNAAWLAGQPASRREGSRGPGRIESGIDTALYIEIGLGPSPAQGSPLAIADPPLLDNVAAKAVRTADGYAFTFDHSAPSSCPLYLVFHGVDLNEAVRLANGLRPL